MQVKPPFAPLRLPQRAFLETWTEGEAMAADEVRVLDGAIDEDRVLGIVEVRRVEERIVEDAPEEEQMPKLD